MPPPTEPGVTHALLFLLSLAARPLSDGSEPDFIWLDRAVLWRLAQAARVPLGRNTFHALVANFAAAQKELAEVRNGRARSRSVALCRVESDRYTWSSFWEQQGQSGLDAATATALALGLDITDPIPEDLLQPPPDDDEDEDDKTCTRCACTKPVEEFPLRRGGPRRSSWCTACTRSATADNRRRQRVAAGLPADPAPSPPPDTRPGRTCPGCRQRLKDAAFHVDRSRSSGLAVRCKGCRSRAAADDRLRAYTDFN